MPALVAGDLVTSARQLTFGAQGLQKVSDAMLLAELTQQDMLLTQLVTQYAPNMLAYVDGTLYVNDAENEFGYALDAGIHYRNFTHYDPQTQKYTPINIVDWAEQERTTSHPSGMLNAIGDSGTFYPVDPLSKRWQDDEAREWFDESREHQVIYNFVRMPQVLTSLSDELVTPVMGREVLVAALVMRILLANPETPVARVQDASANFVNARNSYFFQVVKFGHPAGQRAGPGGTPTDAAWVQDQIS